MSGCRNVSHRFRIVRVPNCLGAEMSHTGAEVSWSRFVPVPKCLAFIYNKRQSSIQPEMLRHLMFISIERYWFNFDTQSTCTFKFNRWCTTMSKASWIRSILYNYRLDGSHLLFENQTWKLMIRHSCHAMMASFDTNDFMPKWYTCMLIFFN